MPPKLLNFLAFQVGWLACVLGGANGLPWIGAGVGLMIVLWHLRWMAPSANEWMLIAAAAFTGIVWDSLLVISGVVTYPPGQLFSRAAPVWIVVMWMLFATTLNLSLSWLQGRYLMAAVLGAVAGPLAYRAGAALGGISFDDPPLAMTLLALGWAVFTPGLLVVASRLSRGAPGAALDRA